MIADYLFSLVNDHKMGEKELFKLGLFIKLGVFKSYCCVGADCQACVLCSGTVLRLCL